MTCFYDRLEQRIAKCGNPVSMGIDPVLKLIPLEGTPEDRIKRFYSDILECCLKRNVQPAVVKPNSAYYECVSIQSMLVLQQLIADYRSAGIPVILDAKRGDIGKSSAAYANAAYDIYRNLILQTLFLQDLFKTFFDLHGIVGEAAGTAAEHDMALAVRSAELVVHGFGTGCDGAFQCFNILDHTAAPFSASW